MAARSRTKDLTKYRGDAWNTARTVHLGGNQVIYDRHECEDQTGIGDCKPFETEWRYFTGGEINRPPSATGNNFVNYIADGLTNPANFPHNVVPGQLSNTAYATALAARTNPSRPYVDLPVAALELGDVTQLIRDVGRGILRRIGSTNIRYQFGIAPLVSDLVKLGHFRQAFLHRKKEIVRLMGPKGYRRTVTLFNGSVNNVRNVDMQSNLASIFNVPCRSTTIKKIRGHIRWVPEHELEGVGVDDPVMESMIRRALLGWTFDRSTVWEALPWTWLIDWGTNVGQYFTAQRNIIPAKVQELNIMHHTRTLHLFDDRVYATNPTGTFNGGSRYRETKLRSAKVSVLPTAHFPFLSGNQVGILASLFVTRRR